METMQSWYGLKDEHTDFTVENDMDAFFSRHRAGRKAPEHPS